MSRQKQAKKLFEGVGNEEEKKNYLSNWTILAE